MEMESCSPYIEIEPTNSQILLVSVKVTVVESLGYLFVGHSVQQPYSNPVDIHLPQHIRYRDYDSAQRPKQTEVAFKIAMMPLRCPTLDIPCHDDSG